MDKESLKGLQDATKEDRAVARQMEDDKGPHTPVKTPVDTEDTGDDRKPREGGIYGY